MPYATVKSFKFSFSMSIFIRSMGTGEPATIPVLLTEIVIFIEVSPLRKYLSRLKSTASPAA